MSSNVTLYFIRHGETDWNAQARYQGQRDVPINARGREQARRNGLVLADMLGGASGLPFIASPLSRTRETMEIVRDTMGLPVAGYELEPTLIEISYGAWEGQLARELEEHDAAAVTARRARPFTWRPQGGESYADLTARLRPWVETIDQDMVVVSHGGVSKALRHLLLGIDPDEATRLPAHQDRILLLRRRVQDAGLVWSGEWV